jgi:misacylated tRNA(Ala) deacylase
MTELLFNQDAYLQNCEAVITNISDNTIQLNRTVFYAESGGQPGDLGKITVGDRVLNVIDTQKGSDPKEILHIVEGEVDDSLVGKEVEAQIDWELRHAHMKMHTSCHILCSLVDALITGASVGNQKSRVDFDVDPSLLNKEEMNQKIEKIINNDYPIFVKQIAGDEFKNNMHLSRGASVSPPVIDNRIQVVQIGEDGNIIDQQFCGGTHCKSTKEIGALEIGKIENKGKRFRRINLKFK